MYVFKFGDAEKLTQAEATLHLALFAVEGIVGAAQLRLDVAFEVDEAELTIRVDDVTGSGAMLARSFTGLLVRELGESGFEVRPEAVVVASKGG